MNPTMVSQTPAGADWNWKRTWPALLALVIGVIAIDSQSFWIDETVTAILAAQPTLSEWWRTFSSLKITEIQMPGYIFYIWAWDKIFGCSEWGLRAGNLLWLVPGFLALPRRQIYYLLLLSVSPFLWYYANEARPYAMEIGTTLILLGSLWRWLDLPDGNPDGRREKFLAIGFCFGLAALSSSSLLGMIWAGAFLGATLVVLGWQRALPLARRCLPLLVVTGLSLALLALFYLWTVKKGCRSTPGITGISNIIYIFYELLGLAGLGPGRTDIHGAGLKAFWPFLVPLIFQAAVIAGVFFTGCRFILEKTPRHIWLGTAAALGAASVVLLVAGRIKHVSLLGRHFAPLFPCLLLPLAAGWKNLNERGGWRRILAAAFLLLCLASALSLRFCARHAKDDYRTAASVAIQANASDKRVWWCADGLAGYYYGVPLSPYRSAEAAPGQVWLAVNPQIVWLTNKPPPDLVLLSKPELHDQQGLVRAFLQKNHYQETRALPAFMVWQRN